MGSNKGNIMRGGSAQDFVDLDDTPANYSGKAGQFPVVNAGETALEMTGAITVTPAPSTKTANYEIQTTDFGVGKSIRMTNAASRTFSFAALGASEDGYRITLVKGGAGDVIVDAGALNIGDTSSGQLTNSGGAGAIGESVTLEYVHASTILLIVGLFGTWTEAA